MGFHTFDPFSGNDLNFQIHHPWHRHHRLMYMWSTSPWAANSFLDLLDLFLWTIFNFLSMPLSKIKSPALHLRSPVVCASTVKTMCKNPRKNLSWIWRKKRKELEKLNWTSWSIEDSKNRWNGWDFPGRLRFVKMLRRSAWRTRGAKTIENWESSKSKLVRWG